MSTSADTTARPAVPGPIVAGWVACAGLAIGALGTWASIGIFSVNGLDDGRDGIITLIAGILAAIALWRCFRDPRSRAAIAVLVLGALASLIAIVDIADISGEDAGEFFGQTIEITVGWGLWVTALAAIALTVAGALLLVQRRRLKAQQPPPADVPA